MAFNIGKKSELIIWTNAGSRRLNANEQISVKFESN